MDRQEQWDRITHKKGQLDQHRPLSASVAQKLAEYFDVEWTYHSNAIEGSTLTRRETQLVLQHGLTVGGKPLVEHLEAINHKHAIDFVETLADTGTPITEHTIRQIHTLILRTIDDEEAGRYRRGQVRITGSEYVPPEAVSVPALMQELVAWLDSDDASARHPVETAALSHFRLVHIHPFVDGNGRTARLLMNLWLMRASYPPAVIRNEDRDAYYSALDAAHAGETDSFVSLVASAVERSLDIYLDAT
ncbi:MAG: Fic family protein [Anaerolineae bacterium]